MTYRDMQRRLAALEQHAAADTSPVDPLAVRVVDYRKAIDPNALQAGPIRICWVDYAALEERTAAACSPLPAVGASRLPDEALAPRSVAHMQPGGQHKAAPEDAA